MKTFLITAFLLIAICATACSGIPKSFCFVKTLRSADHVICGVITAKASHSLKMHVIDVLSGVETRLVITIWDGTDFDCNGVVSMKAGDLGNVGDTIIAILPMISGVLENVWDVAGDYRRPYTLFETALLHVSKDSVRGYITSLPNTPVSKYPYTDFKNYWQNHGNDCMTLSIKETDARNVNVFFYDGRITINSLSGECFQVKLYSVDGRLLAELSTDRMQYMNCGHLPAGVYLLTVSKGSNVLMAKKAIL